MTPKEKAKELVNKHYNKMVYLKHQYNPNEVGDASKQCAIIAVDEIINLCASGLSETKYWKEVKQEIENL